MPGTPKRELSLYDSTCIIVGIIIGVGIYQMAPDIAKGAGSAWGVLALWTVGGLLSLCGALSYAELATAYPRAGGDYVYLTKAYGRWAGFLFGWAQLTVVRPGDILVMAFAFATYGRQLYDPYPSNPEVSQRIFAASAVLVLTLINIIGVKQGKWTQNLLTLVKALGLLAIVVIAFVTPARAGTVIEFEPLPVSLALIFVLFTYGGWNEMAYVAAEVRNPRKNIARALVIGTAAVLILYLLVNGAFLYTLGYEGLATSDAVASECIAAAFPAGGSRFISLLVCLSALGVVNGQIFTGARISYAMGAEHPIFRRLGRWDSHTGTPISALIVQAIIALGLILILGGYIDAILYNAAVVFSFYLATSIAVIVLRHKEPQVERPFRIIGYPITPLVFSSVCVFLIYSSIIYAYSFKRLSLLVMIVALVTGLVVYRFTERRSSTKMVRQSDSPTV
ncbi:APC family permease [Planctomycetota bacterium]